jgi:hypothetical protein
MVIPIENEAHGTTFFTVTCLNFGGNNVLSLTVESKGLLGCVGMIKNNVAHTPTDPHDHMIQCQDMIQSSHTQAALVPFSLGA